MTRVVDVTRGFACDVKVTRPSRWGNPYVVARPGGRAGTGVTLVGTLGEALRGFERHLSTHPRLVEAVRTELRGKTLGCVCTTDLYGDGEVVCHAQILARVADGKKLPILRGLAWA